MSRKKSVINKSRVLGYFGILTLITFVSSFTTISAQHGLKAEYYNGVEFDEFVAFQYVGNINNFWNENPPIVGLDPHYCSIRWTGKLIIQESRNYVFSARVDDGIRVWIDDRLIINQWELNDQGIFEGKIYLEAGKIYKLKVDYFNALNEGEIQLLWEIPYDDQTWTQYLTGQTTVPVPESNLFRPEEARETVMKVPAPVIVGKPINKPKEKKTIPPQKEEVQVIQQTTKQKEVTTVKEAEKFIPKNIAFERGKDIFLAESLPELDVFAKFMLDNSHVSVMIEGHTDPVGDRNLNLILSRDRAFKVAKYLVEKGISKSRIKAEGYGGSRPLVVPKQGEYYPANRRVVFLLSGLD